MIMVCSLHFPRVSRVNEDVVCVVSDMFAEFVVVVVNADVQFPLPLLL